MRFEEIPNTEAAVNVALQADGLRAYSSSPKRGAVYPHIVTARLGGLPGERHALDGPRIQFDVWGDEDTDKSTVLDYARQALRLAQELEGETVELSNDERVWIAGVDIEIGPQWLPDPRTTRPRYIFSLRIYARQLSPASSSS